MKPPSPDSPVAQGAPRTLSATIRSMQLGLHLITAVLVVVACLRALADGTPGGPVLLGGLVFSGWYVGGVVLAGRVDDRPVAAWWLAGLALIWVGAVAASAEFIWLAFPLWLLAGYILRWRWAVVCAIAVFLVVAVAPLLQFGTTSYANVIGPLLGGTFALFISRGYVELVNDLQERQRLVASLVHAQTEMAALQEELAQTQRLSGAKAERTRIPRDIHDTVAQGLSSIRLLAPSGSSPRSPATTWSTCAASSPRSRPRRSRKERSPERSGACSIGSRRRRASPPSSASTRVCPRFRPPSRWRCCGRPSQPSPTCASTPRPPGWS